MEMTHLYPMLNELHARKQELDRVIAILERYDALEAAYSRPRRTPGRRGRKSMGKAERAEVSERMTNYWANRRKSA